MSKKKGRPVEEVQEAQGGNDRPPNPNAPDLNEILAKRIDGLEEAIVNMANAIQVSQLELSTRVDAIADRINLPERLLGVKK